MYMSVKRALSSHKVRVSNIVKSKRFHVVGRVLQVTTEISPIYVCIGCLAQNMKTE